MNEKMIKMGFQVEDVVSDNNPFGSKAHVVGTAAKPRPEPISVIPDKGHVAPSSALPTTIAALKAEVAKIEQSLQQTKEYIKFLEEVSAE
jgi:hypothetical protein